MFSLLLLPALPHLRQKSVFVLPHALYQRLVSSLFVRCSPEHHFSQHRREIHSLSRQQVPHLPPIGRVRSRPDNSMLLKLPQPVRQNVRGDALGRFQELVIALVALQHHVPNNQQRPAIAENLNRCVQRTPRPSLNAWLLPLHRLPLFHYNLHFTSNSCRLSRRVIPTTFPQGLHMPVNELLLREFDQEMSRTQATLERVPAANWDWKPQPKSGSLAWMAGHVATLPGFGFVILTTPVFETTTARIPKVERHAELLDGFAQRRKDARSALASVTDEQLQQTWTMKRDGRTLFSMPRYDAFRVMFLNHIVRHRGQLTMCLRQRDIPVPPLYGPSADENPFV